MTLSAKGWVTGFGLFRRQVMDLAAMAKVERAARDVVFHDNSLHCSFASIFELRCVETLHRIFTIKQCGVKARIGDHMYTTASPATSRLPTCPRPQAGFQAKSTRVRTTVNVKEAQIQSSTQVENSCPVWTSEFSRTQQQRVLLGPRLRADPLSLTLSSGIARNRKRPELLQRHLEGREPRSIVV